MPKKMASIQEAQARVLAALEKLPVGQRKEMITALKSLRRAWALHLGNVVERNKGTDWRGGWVP
jgi:hypothetical protein